MKKSVFALFALLFAFFCLQTPTALAKDATPPEVVSSSPANGATDVSPHLKEISVTFSEPMMDNSWSWVYEDKNTFPKMTGQPYFKNGGKTCVLPVKLVPGKIYTIWINSAQFRNFKDKARNPAIPHRIVFSTEK